MLDRLHRFALLACFCGLLALVAMAIGLSFDIVFWSLCGATLASVALAVIQSRHQRAVERSGQAMGQFMRGQWQARLVPELRDDAWSRLQHRINNLLDVLDLHLRGDEAAIDQVNHATYVEKLRSTTLYESLDQGQLLADTRAERTAEESVGALLQQLGHNVANLFADGEEKNGDAATNKKTEAAVEASSPAAAATVVRERSRLVARLEAAAQRVQATSAQLAQRAMLPNVTGPEKPTPAALDGIMARIAEQATVVALNVAIEAGRAAPDAGIQQVASELHGMAAALHKVRADMAALLATAIPLEQRITSVPLSSAIEALAHAESVLQEQAAFMAGDAVLPLAAVEEAA